MAVKKSQIYSSLWKSCDALRGGMDASQYKDYILTLLFLKYVSDRAETDPDAQIDVPEGASFADMVKLDGQKDIGEKIDIIIAKLAEANGLGGVIDNAKFNDPSKLGEGKEMVERLSKLVAIFNRPELDFRKNRAEGDDILGDAYEYLMRHFATESGKSKGQFYTPAEVSRIMAKVVGINDNTTRQHSIYDPTCGSGSLLLKARDAAPDGITIYGQEKDVATFALARMNMVIHNSADAEIWPGNTLSKPYHKGPDGGLKTFDFVVANPPFSDKDWSTGLNPTEDEFERFKLGEPPLKNGDYAYLLHVLASLKTTGKGAIILPHGVLFRAGAEGDIRRELIKKGYIKGVIGLPANLFYGTGIPACLVVLDKESAGSRSGIFMIDASQGFAKDGPKNRLRQADVHKIVDVFLRQTEVSRYSRHVPFAEIDANGGNLNIPRYIDSSEPEDLQDIDAHMRGGIPERDVDALQPYWDIMPGLRADLFGAGDRPGYAVAKIGPSEVRTRIHAHVEFQAFAASITTIFNEWRAANAQAMFGFGKGQHPKDLIAARSEDFLTRFKGAPLVDGYDAYQHIMNYWAEVMQDDAYLIAADGWEAAKVVRELVKGTDGKFTEEPDLTLGSGRGAKKVKAEIIPPTLIIERFFVDQNVAISALLNEVDGLEREIAQIEEEHDVEDGLLSGARAEADKLTVAGVRGRLSGIKHDADASEERAVLKRWMELALALADKSKRAKEAQATLNLAVIARYKRLDEAEIKSLVVQDKWVSSIWACIKDEIERVGHALTARIRTLTERYSTPLSKISERAATFEQSVLGHLTAIESGGGETVRQGLLSGQIRLRRFVKDGYKLKDSDIGPIPDDWDVMPLGQLGDPVIGLTYRPSDVRVTGTLVLRSSNIHNGNLKFEDNVFVDPVVANRAKVRLGDILICVRNGSRALIGKCARIDESALGMAFGAFMCIFRTKHSDFIIHQLQSELIKRQINEHLGATINQITNSSLRNFKIAFPRDPEERAAIARCLDDFDGHVLSLEDKAAKLRMMKAGMSQRLLTGRVRLI